MKDPVDGKPITSDELLGGLISPNGGARARNRIRLFDGTRGGVPSLLTPNSNECEEPPKMVEFGELGREVFGLVVGFG